MRTLATSHYFENRLSLIEEASTFLTRSTAESKVLLDRHCEYRCDTEAALAGGWKNKRAHVHAFWEGQIMVPSSGKSREKYEEDLL